MKTQSHLTKGGEIKKIYANAIRNCRFDGRKIHPVSYSGTGNFISKNDYSFYVKYFLKLKGYKFTTGNDAPRGGENGNYYKVSRTAINYLNLIRL